MKPSAEIAASLLSQHGIRHVVLSPGSRNAPLMLALQEEPELKLTDVIDERAAGFVALGLARQSRTPVALVCTSGTALLNYGPATAEAFYQGIPLIILSADRPMQWIDQDDSQTIRQVGALGNVVKGSFDIPDFTPDDAEMRWYASRTVNEAILLSTSRKPGPVHVNLQYNAPLVTEEKLPFPPHTVQMLQGNNELDIATSRRLGERLRYKKVLLVAGYLSPSDSMARILDRFHTLQNVAILPEALANLHLKELGGIDKILSGLDSATLQSLLPDVVITFGGALLSRKVKEWLRSLIHGALESGSGRQPRRLFQASHIENHSQSRAVLLTVRTVNVKNVHTVGLCRTMEKSRKTGSSIRREIHAVGTMVRPLCPPPGFQLHSQRLERFLFQRHLCALCRTFCKPHAATVAMQPRHKRHRRLYRHCRWQLFGLFRYYLAHYRRHESAP